MRATAHDVAALAGVSISTVSRALNGSADISERVRARVIAVAGDVGYLPHVSTRAPGAHPVGTLGLVVHDADDPFMGALVTGVRKRANSAGHLVTVLDVDAGGDLVDEMRDLAAVADGLVISALVPRELLDAAGGRPSVTLTTTADGPPDVVVDYAEGVRQALTWLTALGHTRVALVGGPLDSDLSARWVAFSTAFAASWTDMDLVDLGGFPLDRASGIAAADLAIASGATAVCAYHDVLALGLLEGLRRRGVDVPGDMSVIGAGERTASRATAALTRIHVPMVDAGRASVDLLLSVLRDPTLPPAHHWDLGVHLVIGESTARAAGAPR